MIQCSNTKSYYSSATPFVYLGFQIFICLPFQFYLIYFIFFNLFFGVDLEMIRTSKYITSDIITIATD
jgi:hypothetical protein